MHLGPRGQGGVVLPPSDVGSLRADLGEQGHHGGVGAAAAEGAHGARSVPGGQGPKRKPWLGQQSTTKEAVHVSKLLPDGFYAADERREPSQAHHQTRAAHVHPISHGILTIRNGWS